MHLAQVLQMAMREQQGDKTGSFPERKYVDEMKLDGVNKTRNKLVIPGIVASVIVAGTWIWKLIK
jgi:hypothetical protein